VTKANDAPESGQSLAHGGIGCMSRLEARIEESLLIIFDRFDF